MKSYLYLPEKTKKGSNISAIIVDDNTITYQFLKMTPDYFLIITDQFHFKIQAQFLKKKFK